MRLFSMAYQCRKCSYRFESSIKLQKKCPFCGSIGSVVTEKTAEDVINEIENMMKEGAAE